MNVSVDVFIVTYNSRRHLPELISSLGQVRQPVRIRFLDNASTDGTPDEVLKCVDTLRQPAFCQRSLRNHGFGGGVNLLAAQSSADFFFLLNPDTRLEPGCLERLVERALKDERIALCEARQSPHEHPKVVDPETQETSWCSGAALLVRRTAFEEVGGFDDHAFFMYCEDIDLSWKMWLSGWRCVYVPEAAVCHWTGGLTAGKRRTTENYYSFRNTLFLFYRFGTWVERGLVWRYLVHRFCSTAFTVSSKCLFAIALLEHIRYIPSLVKSRRSWNRRHRWIRLDQTSLAG